MRKEIEEILAKGSFDSADVDILAKNQSLLTQEEKVRLGFAPATAPTMEAPVVEEFIPEVEVPVVAESKSVKRKKVISKKKV